jgi:AcrR family transcriptional regulator
MSTVKSRTRRTPEAARENILAAAESLLAAQGPQALKLADIAAAAGVSNASVLHHFGSIQEVQTALMERMVGRLVEMILAAPIDPTDIIASRDQGLRALFDAFDDRGASRLAAWLVLTEETSRLTTVRKAIQDVVTKRMAPAGLPPEMAENLVLVSVVLAMGVGLFGDSLGALMGKPPGFARTLAERLLHSLAPPEKA